MLEFYYFILKGESGMYKIKLYSSDGTLKKSFTVYNSYRFEERVRLLIRSGAFLIDKTIDLAELIE